MGRVTRTATLAWVKQGYTDGTRRLASRWIGGLARTRVTPNALAHDDTSSRTGVTSAAAQQRPGGAARRAADRQGRTEAGWMAEQLRAERASRR